MKRWLIGFLLLVGVDALLAQQPDRPREFFSAVNNVVKCDRFPGADAGARIQNCLTSEMLPTGGVADARGLQGTQTLSAITISRPATLLLGAATFTQTGRIRVTTSGVHIKGLGPTQTILRVAASTQINAVELNNPTSGGLLANTINDVGVSDLAIDGNRAANVDGGNDESQNGIIATEVVRGFFSNLYLSNSFYNGLSIDINSSDVQGQGIITENNGRATDYGGVLLSGTVTRCRLSFVSIGDTQAGWLVNNANNNLLSYVASGGRNGVVIDNSDRNVVFVTGTGGTGTGVTIQDGVGASSNNLVIGHTSGYATPFAITAADGTNRVYQDQAFRTGGGSIRIIPNAAQAADFFQVRNAADSGSHLAVDLNGVVIGSNFQAGTGQYRWDESGVRAWNAQATGGNLRIMSGDGAGAIVPDAAGRDFGTSGLPWDVAVEILAMNPVAFASLGTPANGTVRYCSDCTIANPCAGAGTGALAKRLNGVWVCN